jgi:predicted DNA-binding transcriptional regulator YafY
VFKIVAYGWALNRVVRLRHVPRSTGHEEVGELRPYLLEPSAIGSAIYAIGRVDPPGDVRVVKLERVVAAELTLATFVPPSLDELVARLDRAWGVWLSDEAATTVELQFGAEVASRVRETRWHPSQRIADAADGGLLMTVDVTSTVEMVPWILGWGRHCEVLAPANLRRQIGAELADAAGVYGLVGG